jgi:hypothetical protein
LDIRWGWVAALSTAIIIGVVIWRFGYWIFETPEFVAAAAIALLFVLWAQRGQPPSVWSIAITGGAAYFVMWVIGLDAHWYIKGPLLIGGFFLMSAANAAVRADQRRVQRRRDAVAAEILRSVRAAAKDLPRFALFLRPFASADHLPAQPLPSERLTPSEGFPRHLDVESLLARALRKECPLIALGREGDIQEGAGRITVADDEWRDAIAQLGARAAFQLILPSTHPGTLWELERLVREEHLGLRMTLRHLGLLPVRDTDDAHALEAFASAVWHRGRTLEYALVVAADLYLCWSDSQTASDLLRRALVAGGRRPRFSLAFIENLEDRAAKLASAGNNAGARACLELATTFTGATRPHQVIQ